MYDLPQMGKYKGVYEMDKDIITNFENLYRAYKKAKLGKSHNGSCARFQNMSLEGIHLLKEQLENPGVYELPENSRVYEAVAMAGGMTEDAGMEAVNQAEFVTDGQMLRIPTMEEVAAAQEESESNVDDGLLDINRASVADFMTLPGIGQSKAEALFQYREAHGRFSSIEEIMNVDGIKEGVFNKIKDSIKV